LAILIWKLRRTIQREEKASGLDITVIIRVQNGKLVIGLVGLGNHDTKEKMGRTLR